VNEIHGIFDWPDDTPIHEAVFQALGYASLCWEPRPDGVFDSTRAEQAGEELLAFLRRKAIGIDLDWETTNPRLHLYEEAGSQTPGECRICGNVPDAALHYWAKHLSENQR